MALDGAFLEAQGARRLSEKPAIYELRRRPWSWRSALSLHRERELHERQVRLLEALRQVPGPLFLSGPDDPAEHGPPGSWHSSESAPDADTWRVAPEPTTEALLEGCLLAGGWALYAAPKPVPPRALPDLSRDPAETVASFLAERRVRVLITAFFDNIEWDIALGARS